MNEFFDLHDNIFIKMDINWSDGDATLYFSNNKIIICKNTIKIDFSRKMEWGKSICVNMYELKKIDMYQNLSIEIQSGDIISITAEKIIFS